MAELLLFPLFDSTTEPPDAAARREALNILSSFIVEAPAGSGKTGLLIQRFLKLLADPQITAPEQVLAITFTRKATAEMRDRVMSHLDAAMRVLPVGESEFEQQTRVLAQAVLERDQQLGWGLLQQPARLRISTIDSLCAEIARSLPVLSGSGGRLTPTEDAVPLLREAAHRTLLQLGGGDAVFDSALRTLLLHRDGNLFNCESLIADMLELRDHWGDLLWRELVPLNQRPRLSDEYLDANVLPRLQRALDHAICSALTRLKDMFPPDALYELSELAAELAQNGGYKGSHSPIAHCASRTAPPEPCGEDLEYWLALKHLLVTQQGQWRRGFAANHLGFSIETGQKQRLTGILERLAHRDDLREELCRLEKLPPHTYPQSQWAVAKALFRVLSHALVELQIVFSERNGCDFTELSLLAQHALSQNSGPNDLAEALGFRLQHLLVDEMQDTSASQYRLLEMLTRSWDGFSQTVFLVGDPRQSIYLFRQARVERFLQAKRELRLGDLPLRYLNLTANFRSQQNLVSSFNEHFTRIFPKPDDTLPYENADAILPPEPQAAALVWHPNPVRYVANGEEPSSAELRAEQRRRDAHEIAKIVAAWFANPLSGNRKKIRTSGGQQVPEPWRIAVLVRSRNHLAEIVPVLRDHGIPYRAVDVESLSERQEVLDLLALTRVLLHPADRTAGLAVLRAPWCGLPMSELLVLTGEGDPELSKLSVLRLISDRGHLLTAESRNRVARVQIVLESAAVQSDRTTTSQLVERAWKSLGGHLPLTPTELANARRYFQLLSAIERESQGRIDLKVLESGLQRLFAETEPVAPEVACVDLLTIHKAKGLEWDVVIIPSLDRLPMADSPPLLTCAVLDESDSDASAAHIMLAPISAKGDDLDPLNGWLKSMQQARELAEYKRLFYVACTRARQELHLFAAPPRNKDGVVSPRPATLLHASWPAAAPQFPLVVEETSPEIISLEIAAAASPRKLRSTAISPLLRRLPSHLDSAAQFRALSPLWRSTPDDSPSAAEFTRPEGSYAARSFGNAVHAMLEVSSRALASGKAATDLLQQLPAFQSRIAALLRADGLPPDTVRTRATEGVQVLERVFRDPDGLWVLSPHPQAETEFALTAWVAPGHAASVRADRVFRAGDVPHAAGDQFLWIVDHKTSDHASTGLEHFIEQQRETYAGQLAAYARILAPAYGRPPNQVRVALYFPVLSRLVWWNPAEPQS